MSDGGEEMKLPEAVDERPPAIENAPAVTTTTNLPATVPLAPIRNRRRLRFSVGLVVVVLAAGGGGIYWWKHSQSRLPPGISWGNGRLEADEIDIDTKFPGRIAELRADIGDMVTAGQLVARMDTKDIQESLKKAQAQVKQAQRAIDEANANLEQQRTQQTLAAQELERTQTLLNNGYATRELFDQRKQAMDATNAGIRAATERVAQAERGLEASQHDVGLYTVNIADNDLVAPRDGRIQYRIANIGEVLSAGGKVFTMLDVSYVYMDVYLPALEAGKVKVGADARILLDAYPDSPDSGESLLPGEPGAVYPENGGDPERTRQADVPDPRAHRSRALARSRSVRA